MFTPSNILQMQYQFVIFSHTSCRIMFRIFDGMFWSLPAYVTITIEPVNDNPPDLNLVPRGEAYIEGTVEGVVLLSDVILTDPDHNNRFNFTELHVSTGRKKC